MVIFQSVGSLAALDSGWYPSQVYSGIRLYDQFNYDYATLYRTQPNVRVCVEFLARNIAQLGLHVFRRIDETDRVRLRDHPLAQLIARPLPAQFKLTRYRLIEALISDMGVYFNAYWLKVRGGDGLGLLRIPPPMVEVKGALLPTGYKVMFSGSPKNFTPEEIVHFRGYNPGSPITGLSPLETLRRVLAEEHAAGDYREYFWRNAARMHGIIERPKDAPKWSDPARERFKKEFEMLYAGKENSGKTAILEEGMTWKPSEFNAQESEYLAGRKLTREECARAYHIPLPMVGILDHATFSNIKEQHKNLYQDSLGPWLAMLEEDIALQLLPEFADTEGVYVEFNITEKLQGSFEEQTAALQSSVGRPWMTPDEARARFNMPSMGGDAGELATPLNVLIGGQASPQDSAPKSLEAKAKANVELDPTQPALRDRYTEQWTRLMVQIFNRQRDSVTSKIPSSEIPDMAVLWDTERWNKEVFEDMYKLSYQTVLEWAQFVAGILKFDLSEEELQPWINENARIAAEYVNDSTLRQITDARMETEPLDAIKRVFELAVGFRAGEIALSRVTLLSNFGSQDAARQGGLRTKTWHTGTNPRPSHAAQDGVTVGIRDTFPNGLRWPGDPRGSADDNAGCNCGMSYGK